MPTISQPQVAIDQDADVRSVIDFDVHGCVGVRLIDPLPKDIAAVVGQIGPLQVRSLDRDPDITVRYVNELATSNLRYVTYPGTGYTEEGKFLLQDGRNPARAQIDFCQLGGKCEVVCRRGSGRVPQLILIVTMTALSRGFVPLHGSSFVYGGTGVIVTGWAKGGKTEALLAFAEHGATYVGDEWILLRSDGTKVFGIPEQIRLWEWHLKNRPDLFKKVCGQDRWLFRVIHALEWAAKSSPRNLQERFPFRRLREAMPALKRQLHVVLTPEEIFGKRSGPFTAEPKKLFFMVSHQRPNIEIEPADPLAVARRMSSSVRFEQLPLWSSYLESRFAFPNATNEFLEHAHELTAQLLCRALSGMKAYEVRHPYPVSFKCLYREMLPYVQASAAKPRSGAIAV